MLSSLSMHYGPLLDKDGVTFRLYAPSAHCVSVTTQGKTIPMIAAEDGWYNVHVAGIKAGAQYHFGIDETLAVPDPASRFQPEGITGESEIADPDDFTWTDDAWEGRPWEETVLYELHVGCFSGRGDYASVVEKLDYLKQLGVTAIELMPLAEFGGARGWGYDGVLPFAPKCNYGTRRDLKHLVNEAHGRGLMVFLDVVYNHFGPEGNFLHRYADSFFTDEYKTPWGSAINFESNREVRQFFIENALYWLDEFHFDGLRFDAVHAICDASTPPILEELAHTIRNSFPPERHVHLVLENDNNEARYLKYDERFKPVHYNAQWNDDIHHILHVLLTGETHGYYADYAHDPVGRLMRCLSQGFDYQGQLSAHRGGVKRGEKSTHLPPQAMVSFVQNHDQIGNRAFGERIGSMAAPERVELALALLLLAPQIPMLFMGEEWDASEPFLYFCDFQGELAQAVREGRRKEFEHFPEFSDPEKRDRIPDPNAPESFTRSKLNWAEMAEASHIVRRGVVERLLHLRKQHIVPLLKQGLKVHNCKRAGDKAFEIQWTSERGISLYLRANFSEAPVLFPEHTRQIIWGENAHALTPLRCQWSIDPYE